MRPGARQHSLGGGTCLVPASMERSGGTSPVRVPGERRGVRLLFLVAWRRAWYWRVRLSGLPSSLEASRAVAGILAHRCVTTGAGAGVMAEPEAIFMSVYGGFWVNLLHFLLARFTLGNMEHYYVAALYLAVLFPVSGCCLRRTVIGFFGRSCLSLLRNAWLDSEYMFCISTGRCLDELHTICTLSGLES